MKRGVKFIPPDPQALAQAYRDGRSAAQIAQGLGCSPDTVGRLLKAQGVQLREAGRTPRAISPAEVARLHRDGWSVTEIAQIFSCQRATITHRLKQAAAAGGAEHAQARSRG